MFDTLKRHFATLAVAAGLATVPLTGSAFASAEFVINYADFGADRGPRAAEMHRWADEINKRTDGRVEVDFHFSSSLLKSKDMLQGVRGGIADMGTVVASNTPSEMPLWMYGGRPMNEGDTWVGVMAWAEMAQSNPAMKAEFERNGVKLLLQNGAGPDGLVCNGKVPTNEEELKQLKIRGSGGLLNFFEAMGANVIAITTSDLYGALDRGVVDCINFALPYVKAYKFYEIADNVLVADLAQAFYYGGVINLDFWNSLPPDVQQVIEEVSAEYNERLAKGIIDAVVDSQADLEAGVDGRSMTFTVLDPEERAKWQRHVETVNEELREKARAYSTDAEIDQFLDQLESLKAKYRKIRDEQGYPWESS